VDSPLHECQLCGILSIGQTQLAAMVAPNGHHLVLGDYGLCTGLWEDQHDMRQDMSALKTFL
jgi:hypothetical protein